MLGILIFLVFKFIIPAVVNSIIDLVNNAQNYYNAITTNEIEASWAPFVKDNMANFIFVKPYAQREAESINPTVPRTHILSVLNKYIRR